MNFNRSQPLKCRSTCSALLITSTKASTTDIVHLNGSEFGHFLTTTKLRFGKSGVGRIAMALLASLPIVALHAASTNLNAVADTTIHEAIPTNNFGGGTSFTTGGRLQGGRARALLRFDIAAVIPPGSTINSASLTLNVTATNGPDSTFLLHRVLADWGEGNGADHGFGTTAVADEASWMDRLGPGTPWAGAGGDYDNTASGSQPVAGPGAYVFTSTAMVTDVQSWLDAPEMDFGWLLRSQDEGSAGTIRRFAGRLDLVNPPQLLLDYTAPTTVPATPPVLTNLALVQQALRFSFVAESNRTYTVEYRDSLTAGDWKTLTTISALATETLIDITNAVSSEARFFRVGTP